MMNKVILVLLLILLVIGLAVPSLAQISPHYDLGWSLLSGGGGVRNSANYQIDDVLGQWPDGLSSSGLYQIDPGFWPKGRKIPAQSVYMPVQLKGLD
jgi:hypothetical protein